MRGVQHYVIKFVSDLRRLVVFSGSSVSPTNKADRHYTYMKYYWKWRLKHHKTIKLTLDHHVHTNLHSLIKLKYCSLMLSITQVINHHPLDYAILKFIKYKNILLYNMHLFVYIQYSILFEPSLLSLSMSNGALSNKTSRLHRQTTYVFLSGTAHSSLNCDNLHTTKHLYTSLHNSNSMRRRFYLLLKMFVLCVLTLHLLKNIMTQRA